MGEVISKISPYLPFRDNLPLNFSNAQNNFSSRADKIQREKEKPEESKTIVMPAMRRRQSEQTKFVVPRIYVDYGSRRTSYASDYFRRSSGESGSSRRTSCASSLASMDDRRGSGSSLSSRRTSAASDVDRRGSGSSICSRRTSLLSSECPSRRGSGSSKSSRKSSDASRVGDITDDILAGSWALLFINNYSDHFVLKMGLKIDRCLWQFKRCTVAW